MPHILVRIQTETIDIQPILALPEARQAHSGALVVFCGKVRDEHSTGRTKKRVINLEYEAHHALAEKCIREILQECCEQWSLHFCACIHRLGSVLPGQNAVAVITACTHRAAAYTANSQIIDRIKTEVPLWKKEKYADGTYIWGMQS